MKKGAKIAVHGLILIFACIGLAFTAVFFAMQFGLLNVQGTVEKRNEFFGPLPTITPPAENTNTTETETNGCSDTTKPCPWNETAQWIVVRDALVKDQEVINQVSKETGVPARMIAAAVVPEQIRFFTDNREVFKRYFEPLKILVSLSQFSLGVSGIKQETAEQIELHAASTTSPFYPGEGYAERIAYTADENKSTALYMRLTDEKDHYYSYLYTALFLKEIESQWARAGYDVSKRPDVLVTLFNLGFNASVPKENPQVGGAQITLGGQTYSFGYLGTQFYQSDELNTVFPRP